MHLELRHLRSLRAIHDQGGLARAAEVLNLTQSALSHQIKALEEQAGVELFLRKTKPLRLSAAGMRLLHTAAQVLPLILTGPKESADYFRVLDEFITHTLGESARRHYRIIIDDPAEVARQMKKAMPLVKESRRETDDAYSFNWSIRISPDLQMPFDPTHENMANLKLSPDQPVEVLAADLRRAFSGIVAGNVKEVGIQAIEQYGPYKLHGDPEMMRRMDDLLQGFVAQHRMKLPGGTAYIPCYEIIA